MENETKYCPKCGAMITFGGSCSNCGWKSSNSSPVAHSPTNTKSFLEANKDSNESINETIKTFFDDSNAE